MWSSAQHTSWYIAAVVISFCVTSQSVLTETSGELNPEHSFDASQAFGPGDVREGYDSAEYQTDSKSLLERRGKKQDLIQYSIDIPLGLPPLAVPEDNPLTRQKIDLGRKLFFDRRLSINNTISCAICHIPEQGFTNNEISTAVGVEGRSVLRNAPTLYNVAYQQRIFLDGREISLENQVWQPMTARNEMAAPSIGFVINKIRHMRDYDGLFEAAFDNRGPDIATIGYALASYQRALLSGESPFDRWHFGQNADAVSESAKNGFAVFVGKGRCIVCHRINKDHAMFTDHDFHNTGIGFSSSAGKQLLPHEKTVRVQLAPGVFADMPRATIMALSRHKQKKDLGLYHITENPDDRWKFRTQTLRNIALTSPYMHNGQFTTLKEVIEFYDQGGFPNELLSPLIQPLGLTAKEKQNLEAFLETLTGSNVAAIVADSFAAEIGELSREDPNWVHQSSEF